MDFWFGAPAPHALLALFRVGTSLVLLYALFVRTFDLDSAFSQMDWSVQDELLELNPVLWNVSIFRWIDSPVWLWSMHILAVLIATAFLAGFWTPLMAALSLVFQLSYIHWNPVMMLGVDGLLIVALLYLSLAPSGKMLNVLNRPREGPRRPPPQADPLEEDGVETGWVFWRWSIVRVLQIHLCLIYFQSALARLSTDWLAGTALWHPRMVELGVPYTLESLQSTPYLTSLITYGLLLFELFYGVLIWIKPLRYPVLAVTVMVHITVGIAWNSLPFNLMMLVLNLVFIPPQHLEELLRLLRPYLALPWRIIDIRE